MHKRKPTWSEGKPDGRWRSYDYEDLLKNDKLSVDLFWIKDESLEGSTSLPDPDVLATVIVEACRTPGTVYRHRPELGRREKVTPARPACAIHRCTRGPEYRYPVHRRDGVTACQSDLQVKYMSVDECLRSQGRMSRPAHKDRTRHEVSLDVKAHQSPQESLQKSNFATSIS